MPLFDLLVMVMMERSHSFAASDFRDKVAADATDIRVLLVRSRIHGYSWRAHRLVLCFVKVCEGQTNFQKLGFVMRAV
jgi:hypothetical protein